MNLATFLHKNIQWSLHKNVFESLCGIPSTEEQLTAQMHRLADSYFPQRKRVETLNTEFCLNEIALFTPKTQVEKCAKQYFEEYWQSFLRLKQNFQKSYMVFPANDTMTRIEAIAQLVARCTQFAVDKTVLEDICNRANAIFDLDERERDNLPRVLELYRINFYCAVCKGIFDGNNADVTRLAKMTDNNPLKGDFVKNDYLRHCYYGNGMLTVNVDCLSNSAAKLQRPTAIDVKPYFYCNGKNVFDTFCYSKFGTVTACFLSDGSWLKTEMQYFLQDSCEVRRYRLQNNGKNNKKIVADFLLRHFNVADKATYFSAEGALCLAVEGEEEFYCALALVKDNCIVPCTFEEGRLSQQFSVRQGGTLQFDAVTVYCKDMPSLQEKLHNLNAYGATRCPYLVDKKTENVVNFKTPINPSSHGYVKRMPPVKEATTLNFTYQFGNNDVATFLDNDGNATTLLQGFVFGVGGEKIYGVQRGTMTLLNGGKFSLQGDRVVWNGKQGVCTLFHDEEKHYCVQYTSAQKTLFYFPFEEKCRVQFDNGVFTVCGTQRSFTVTCLDKVESFSTNALECNTERLRYKLSNEMQCGSCLAVCFATSMQARVKISSVSATPTPCPLVRESLVSTYLNYMNGKNVFCLSNRLKRADSLTLASICFTNPKFVKKYVLENVGKENYFYDACGKVKMFTDKLALPLAIVYYANLVRDEDFPSQQLRKYANSVLFKQTFYGRDLCVKALALKKATHLSGFDKVACLIEYNNVKKIISNDSKLYGYAQAIGAVPLTHPSKQRLKDLCNGYNIPKSWYYVSQLENLYGLSLVEGTLNFSPKVTQENVLEQLALNIDGKRIDTTFTKANVQSMTLNGTQYFLPFKPQMLKNADNTLVVKY